MIDSLCVVILAGGKGERFWPLSKPENPKPFLKFFSERSLFQQTYDRALHLVPKDQIFVIVGKQHENLVRQHVEIADSQLILEPAGRDTAAAIGYASLHLPKDAAMLVMPADHLVPEKQLFAETIQSAVSLLSEQNAIFTFGIKPTRPETNYGYIQATNRKIGNHALPAFEVEEFIEKPERTVAEEFVRQSSYYWNSGIFLWRVSRIQELLAEHLPELWHGLQQTFKKHKGPHFDELYSSLPKISIDYGVMQKADRILVVPAAFQWDDIGTWNSLTRIMPLQQDQNLIWGAHSGLDTSNCIVYSENHTIVTAGIEDLIIIQSGNQILICHRNYADRLKELLGKLSL